jgi:uncharacterized protein (DUF433 family)
MVIPSRIVLDSTVAHGRPIIRGTRLPVSIVVGSLAGGMTFEEIQQEYDITVDDIRAALKFVADLADKAVVSLIEKLKSLTPEQRAEAEDFVDFLKARKERARAAAAHHLGEAFAKLDRPLCSRAPSADCRRDLSESPESPFGRRGCEHPTYGRKATDLWVDPRLSC